MKSLIEFYKKKQTMKYRIIEIIINIILEIEKDTNKIINNIQIINNTNLKEEKNQVNSNLINDLYNLRKKYEKLKKIIEKSINENQNSKFAKDLILFAINPLNENKISQIETLNNNLQLLINKLNDFRRVFPNITTNLNNLKSLPITYFN